MAEPDRYPRFVVEIYEQFPWTGDDPDGTPVNVRAMFVQIEAKESTSDTVIPPRGRQPPDITAGNYAIAVDAMRQWCRGRPFEVEEPVPTFADLTAAQVAVINLRRL